MKDNLAKLAVMTSTQVSDKTLRFRRNLEAKIMRAKVILANTDIDAFDNIGLAIDAIFTKYNHVAITMPALIALVCRDMGATQANYKVLASKVQTYIRSSSWMMVTRGKNGGVRSLRGGAPTHSRRKR